MHDGEKDEWIVVEGQKVLCGFVHASEYSLFKRVADVVRHGRLRRLGILSTREKMIEVLQKFEGRGEMEEILTLCEN